MHVLIVGTGRCGSTLLRDLLNLHPACYVCRESYWHIALQNKFGDFPLTEQEFFDGLLSIRFPHGQTIVESNLASFQKSLEDLRRYCQQEIPDREADLLRYLNVVEEFFLASNNKSIFGDKTPHYGYHLQGLVRLWPGLRVVHLHRDGREAALSMAQHPGFRLNAQVGVDDWTAIAPVAHLIARRDPPEQPSVYLEMWARQMQQIAANMATLPKHSTCEVRYADLLAQTKSEMARLAEFLGIEAPPAWLAACEQQIVPPQRTVPIGTYQDYSPRVTRMLAAFNYLSN